MEDNTKYFVGTLSPVIAEGDCIGCVMVIGTEDAREITETDLQLTETGAIFLGKQMES